MNLTTVRKKENVVRGVSIITRCKCKLHVFYYGILMNPERESVGMVMVLSVLC